MHVETDEVGQEAVHHLLCTLVFWKRCCFWYDVDEVRAVVVVRENVVERPARAAYPGDRRTHSVLKPRIVQNAYKSASNRNRDRDSHSLEDPSRFLITQNRVVFASNDAF